MWSQEGSFLSDFICSGEEVIHRSHPSSNECAQKIDLALCSSMLAQLAWANLGCTILYVTNNFFNISSKPWKHCKFV